jgi:hypothetical protein
MLCFGVGAGWSKCWFAETFFWMPAIISIVTLMKKVPVAITILA